MRMNPDDDALPVMVPRNDRALVAISTNRVQRLRHHLDASLLAKSASSRHSRISAKAGTARLPGPRRAAHARLFALPRMVLPQWRGRCIPRRADRCACQRETAGCRSSHSRVLDRVPAVAYLRVHVSSMRSKAARWIARCDRMFAMPISVAACMLMSKAMTQFRRSLSSPASAINCAGHRC